MTVNMITFPVARGIEGMNKLALFLNARHLSGDWHFAAGTRFDQDMVTVNFDEPTDMAPAWQSYCKFQTP